VLELEGERLRFTHPLLASTTYSAAPPRERRDAHARLARAAETNLERAHHLARSTTDPYEAVAAGPARAAQALEQADPRTSVTFVHLACSGATIATGLLGGCTRASTSIPLVTTQDRSVTAASCPTIRRLLLASPSSRTPDCRRYAGGSHDRPPLAGEHFRNRLLAIARGESLVSFVGEQDVDYVVVRDGTALDREARRHRDVLVPVSDQLPVRAYRVIG
jgi:hypothetical protein